MARVQEEEGGQLTGRRNDPQRSHKEDALFLEPSANLCFRRIFQKHWMGWSGGQERRLIRQTRK